MKRWPLAVSIGFLSVLCAGAARAEVATDDSHTERVFGDAGFGGQRGKAIMYEVRQVEDKCEVEEMSREGPSLEDVAACEAAAGRLIRHGSKAIGPILASLDDDSTTWMSRRRLYDVLARTKDTRLIEPLVRAMARIATRKLDGRSWEIDIIHETLAALTHAPVNDPAPWAQATQMAMRRRQIGLVVDWRLWLEKHQGMSHEELVAERTADELQHLEDASHDRANRAIAYLLDRRHPEAFAAAKKFVARASLPKNAAGEMENKVGEVEEKMREEARARPRVSKPAAPAATPAPKSPKPRPADPSLRTLS